MFRRFAYSFSFGLIVILESVMCQTASAQITTKTIEYNDGDTVLEGYVAWDAAKNGVPGVPGVLIVHQWTGLTDYERSRAKQIAELGYVGFALDIYGKGVRPEAMQDAAKESGKYKGDRELYRRRLTLGLDQLKKLTNVDTTRLAAIGYCFGGTGVLELARTGADVDGVVSFHGGLDSTNPEDGKNIQAKILICHGADDPFVPEADIEAMQKEFSDADVDWQMISYSEAVHSFTQTMAGTDKTRGAAYDEKADKRSWKAMKLFFEEVFEPVSAK
jgi:dienelactone hydrolase